MKCAFNKWDGIMDWIDMALDTERWRAVVKAVTKRRVSLKIRGIS